MKGSFETLASEAFISPGLELGRSVLPMPFLKIVSPENSTPSFLYQMQTEPAVCPGVLMISRPHTSLGKGFSSYTEYRVMVSGIGHFSDRKNDPPALLLLKFSEPAMKQIPYLKHNGIFIKDGYCDDQSFINSGHLNNQYL